MFTSRLPSFGAILLIATTGGALPKRSVANEAGTRKEILMGHDDDLWKAHVRNAYDNVERSCAMDVEFLCGAPSTTLLSMMTVHDPVWESIIGGGTSVSSSTWTHFGSPNVFLLDQMLFDLGMVPLYDSFSTPASTSSFLVHSVGDESSPHGADVETKLYETLDIPQIQTLSLIVSDESQEKEMNNKNNRNKNNDSSNLLFGSEQTEIARRRLTGLGDSHQDLQQQQPSVDLPFRCRNDCLRQAYLQRLVSEKCARSIALLEDTHALEAAYVRREEEQAAYFGSLSRTANGIGLLVVVVWVLLLLRWMLRRFHRTSENHRSLRLREAIIATVYHDPSLRKTVELAIGESMWRVVDEEDDDASRESDGDDCGDLVESKRGEKNILSADTICCEGIPVQIV